MTVDRSKLESSDDQEILVLQRITESLSGLDEETRRRVLRYLVDRFSGVRQGSGGALPREE